MAANTMGMAPMLCVLFLGARMRALQMDPINGNPQRWAQNCFFMCTYALIAQTCVAIFVPLVLGGKVEKNTEVEGDMVYKVSDEQKMLAKAITAARFLIMLCVYSGAVAVVCSVFTIEHPKGAEHTPPLSPTMQCVTNLASQYFFIYLLLWIFYTVKDFFDYDMAFLKDAIETAKTTVQFAPIISKEKYVTDSLDGPAKDHNKKIDAKIPGTEYQIPGGHYVVETLRYLALVALLGGITTVITSVFMITPETANGRGSIPVISDGTLGYEL